MNKKIIFLNIVFLILFLFSTELICNLYFYQKYKTSYEGLKANKFPIFLNYTKPFPFDFMLEIRKRQKSVYKSDNNLNNKRPILIAGCSYAYGYGLSEKKNLSYKLNKLTKRTVYNRAFPGGSANCTLYQFRNGIMKEEVPDAEYFIYVFIKAHYDRLVKYQINHTMTEINPRYVLSDGKLIYIKPAFLPGYSLFTVKMLQNFIEKIKCRKDNKNDELFNAIMQELYNETNKSYKDCKQIILLYPEPEVDEKEIMSANEIKILKDIGYQVINAEDLTDKPIDNLEYRLNDKDHPAEKAWDAIVPALIKKLNL